MSRSGGSLASIVAVGAALVVALLGGLTSASDRPAPTGATRIRIGVYDPSALPRPTDASLPSVLADVARRADVVAITARADYESDRVEIVDLTGALAAALRSDGR